MTSKGQVSCKTKEKGGPVQLDEKWLIRGTQGQKRIFGSSKTATPPPLGSIFIAKRLGVHSREPPRGQCLGVCPCPISWTGQGRHALRVYIRVWLHKRKDCGWGWFRSQNHQSWQICPRCCQSGLYIRAVRPEQNEVLLVRRESGVDPRWAASCPQQGAILFSLFEQLILFLTQSPLAAPFL